jgi:Uma2 family endonuclease
VTANLSTSLAAGKIMLTYEDYACLPDDRMRYEIIEGKVVASPSPPIQHQRVSMNILFRLAKDLDYKGKGKVLMAPCDVILSEHNIVQPDLIYICSENASIIREKNIQGSSDLLIEILSPSTRRRDVLTKAGLYAAHGVPHYWIVDPDLDRIETFGLEGDVYASTGTCSAPESMEPTGFPGLVLPLDEVFAS